MSKSTRKNIKNKVENFEDDFLKQNEIIFKKYKPTKLIGKGAFSNIYSAIRLKDQSIFAMKVEKKEQKRKMLEIEAYHLYILQGFGIPKLITFGRNKNYNILIESLLGKALFEIFIKHKKPCDLINTCLIAIQIIERLEFIHSKNLIYRDVKPENFMTGIKDPDVLYIIDFGLCKKYRSSKTGKHIQQRDTKNFCGTLIYSSVNVIKGKESSRKDDLISLGYVILFLYKRNLPWNFSFSSLNKNTYNELVKSKESNHNGEIFKDIPEEIIEFVKYSQNLKFEEDPDYNYMKGLFKKLLIKNNCNFQKINFCWINPNDKDQRPFSKNKLGTKINPRFRILENLKNKRLNSMQIVCEEELGNKLLNNTDEKDKKKNLTLTGFNNYNTNLNKTLESFNKEKKDEIKVENIKNKNVSNRIKINEEKKEEPKNSVKGVINTKNEGGPFSMMYNSLINRERIQYNKININKNVYISNNNNIYLNFTNFKKNSKDNSINNNSNFFNKMNSAKRNINFNISNRNEVLIINNTMNFDANKKSTNINTNNTNVNINKKINKINILKQITRNIQYRSVFAVETNEDSSKMYKSKI